LKKISSEIPPRVVNWDDQGKKSGGDKVPRIRFVRWREERRNRRGKRLEIGYSVRKNQKTKTED